MITGHTMTAPRTSESDNKICKSKLKAMAMITSVRNLEFKTTKPVYSEVCLSPQVSHGNSLNPRVPVQEGSPWHITRQELGGRKPEKTNKPRTLGMVPKLKRLLVLNWKSNPETICLHQLHGLNSREQPTYSLTQSVFNKSLFNAYCVLLGSRTGAVHIS